MIPLLRTGSRFAAVLLCVSVFCSTAHAVAEFHYRGSTVRLAGRLAIEDRTYDGVAHDDIPILHLDSPILVISRSSYPDDPPRTETAEVHLAGEFDFTSFLPCTVVAIGTVDNTLSHVAMSVQRLECRENGKSVGIVKPDPAPAMTREDPYGCEPHSSIALSREFPPYPGLEEEMWVAADLLMRAGTGPRWSYDSFRSLTLRLSDARARLFTAFPGLRAGWEYPYAARTLAVEFSPELQARLDAAAPADNHIRSLPADVDPGLQGLCDAVCGCTVVLQRDADAMVSLNFSPTANILYALRRLRELSEVKAARFVRAEPDAARRRRPRNVLRARMLPAAFHFTVESTDAASGTITKRYFVVDDEHAREVSREEAATMLSFDVDPLPADVWR